MQTMKNVKDDNRKKMGRRDGNCLWWVRKVEDALFKKAAFELRLEEKEKLVIHVRSKKKNTPDKIQELEQSLRGRE